MQKLKNIGTSSADNYSIEIYNDANFDSTADPGEIIFSQQHTNLSSGDSVTANTIMNSLAIGDYQIIAKVVFMPDENPSNNQLVESFNGYLPGNVYNDVVINEIMYAPSTGEPEWVELYNRYFIQSILKKWKFSDAVTSVTISNNDKIIPANDFMFLADESILNYYNVGSEIIVFSLPALNNTGDAIVITDFTGIIIDSLSFHSNLGRKYRW